jgi:hypothetical protein
LNVFIFLFVFTDVVANSHRSLHRSCQKHSNNFRSRPLGFSGQSSASFNPSAGFPGLSDNLTKKKPPFYARPDFLKS